MKKNGFIATSVMFSFFLVFTALIVIVLAAYAHYKVLINNLNMSILDDLNENIIAHKYSFVSNAIKDGNLESIDKDFKSGLTSTYPTFNGIWTGVKNNVVPYHDNDNQISYLKFQYNGSGSAKLSKSLDGKRFVNNRQDHKIYISYKIFKNGLIECSDAKFSLSIGTSDIDVFDKTDLCGDFENWVLKSKLITVFINNVKQEFKIEINGLNSSQQSRFIGIKDLVIADVTKLYKDGTTDEEMKSYLDINLPYIDENYALARR
ncbi:MAG: hypothetical protein IJ572_00980 [Bacilli bacterium]|nr:hypothetical protein [Bacilli bacterium]